MEASARPAPVVLPSTDHERATRAPRRAQSRLAIEVHGFGAEVARRDLNDRAHVPNGRPVRVRQSRRESLECVELARLPSSQRLPMRVTLGALLRRETSTLPARRDRRCLGMHTSDRRTRTGRRQRSIEDHTILVGLDHTGPGRRGRWWCRSGGAGARGGRGGRGHGGRRRQSRHRRPRERWGTHGAPFFVGDGGVSAPVGGGGGLDFKGGGGRAS